MLVTFLARTDPASRHAKPTCITETKNTKIIIHYERCESLRENCGKFGGNMKKT